MNLKMMLRLIILVSVILISVVALVGCPGIVDETERDSKQQLGNLTFDY